MYSSLVTIILYNYSLKSKWMTVMVQVTELTQILSVLDVFVYM